LYQLDNKKLKDCPPPGVEPGGGQSFNFLLSSWYNIPTHEPSRDLISHVKKEKPNHLITRHVRLWLHQAVYKACTILQLTKVAYRTVDEHSVVDSDFLAT
jgi:hypothetical protein